MATATQFFQYWALSFATLAAALVLLSVFYRFIECDLALHKFRTEALIAGMASAAQGAGCWLSLSLFPGQPFKMMVIPVAIVSIIYLLTHLKDWSGYEFGGIALFQTVIWGTGLWLVAGQFKLAVIILGVFVLGLAVIASIAKSL